MRASEIAERALLGAILLDHARLADVQQWLEPADFYAYRHGLVYTEMLELRRAGQEPTARSVLDRVIPSAESRRHVDGPYLHTLMESCPHPSRAPLYGRMVLEASIHRRTADRAEHLGYVAQSESPADVVIDQLRRESTAWLDELDGHERRWTRAGGSHASPGRDFLRGDPSETPLLAAEAAEISVIASLLASPWQYDQIKDWLHPSDFTRSDTRLLYASVVEIARQGQPIDVVTVLWAAIRHVGPADRIDHEVVARLAAAGVPGYAGVCARDVLQASLRSRANTTARQLGRAALQPRMSPDSVLHLVRRELTYVADACSRWPVTSRGASS